MTKPEERHRQLDLCIPYVFGRLNPGNRKQFEAHLATGCVICTKELARLSEATALLPLTLQQEQPHQKVKDLLMSRLSSGKRLSEQEKKRGEKTREEKRGPVTPALAPTTQPQRPWFGYAIAFLSVVIVVALGVYTNDLINTVGEQEQRIVELKTELEQQQALLNILQAPLIEMVIMSGQEASPAGYGKILWDPVKKTAFFQVANLPILPTGKEYQLWVIRKEEKVPSGVFAVRGEQEGYFNVMNLDVAAKNDFDAFAITLEPKGGSPQPTGAIYLLGTTAVN
jgi:anti-sigma-K factor RskA